MFLLTHLVTDFSFGDGDIDFHPRLAYQIGHKSCKGHSLSCIFDICYL